MKHVFISLLNYNGSENTIDCLESLRHISADNFKLTIAVVDNASSDDSIRNIKNYILKNKLSGIKVVQNKENLGFSGGHNVVIRYALKDGADYVLILNNDTYVDQNFLAELIEKGESDKKVGILVPKIYFAPGFEFHKKRYSKNELGKVFWYAGGEIDWKNIIGYNRGVDEVDVGQFSRLEETETATGCCMLIKSVVFEKAGTLDDGYFLYYEDADFCMRIKRKNFKIIYVPKSIIWHKNAGSTGGSGSAIQDYYITRNRLVFGFKYASIRSKLALFRESLSLFLRGRRWQRQGVIDFYLGKLGKGSCEIS